MQQMRLVVLTTERIIQERPEHRNTRNIFSIPDNLEEALNEDDTTKMLGLPKLILIKTFIIFFF